MKYQRKMSSIRKLRTHICLCDKHINLDMVVKQIKQKLFYFELISLISDELYHYIYQQKV